jgi:hypothetical protein
MAPVETRIWLPGCGNDWTSICEEPTRNKTCMNLLTGRLLVRVQPEEPIPLGNSTTFAGVRSRFGVRCPAISTDIQHLLPRVLAIQADKGRQ